MMMGRDVCELINWSVVQIDFSNLVRSMKAILISISLNVTSESFFVDWIQFQNVVLTFIVAARTIEKKCTLHINCSTNEIDLKSESLDLNSSAERRKTLFDFDSYAKQGPIQSARQGNFSIFLYENCT